MSKIRTYESNSQHCRCTRPLTSVVPDVKDTNLWEQFTTTNSGIWTMTPLFLMSKIRTYESNSQLERSIEKFKEVVPDVKDTNLWEQFTTGCSLRDSIQELFLMSKIRTYESNSQLLEGLHYKTVGCSWCQRYELMRAIHNSQTFALYLILLFLMSKIRTYESNSQL